MIPLPASMRVWIAAGHAAMRKGMQGLGLLVQEQLKRDPHAGDLYVFRGRAHFADRGRAFRAMAGSRFT